MGILIRTLYNNQGWEGLCNSPSKDRSCSLCFEPNVNIRPPSPSDEICTGNCWERNLCIKYRWGCTPQGRAFGKRAYIGMKAFFVYKQSDGNYTLWGKTTVQNIDDKVLEDGEDDERGFAFIHFTPFEPLPKDKWVHNLTAYELVGEEWRQGRYRYIDGKREAYLEQLIEGTLAERPIEPSHSGDLTLSIKIMPNIEEKLEEIASKEGRQKDEIVREAIAEWLKGREL